MSSHSTKPYLIRAIHEWCSDQGHTPYLAVAVDEHTMVPMEYVKAGEIVLNVSLAATNRLRLGNDWIEFQARFGGVAREISIPVGNISAIYARETGHGMAFEVNKAPAHIPTPIHPTVSKDEGENTESAQEEGQKSAKPMRSIHGRRHAGKSEASSTASDREPRRLPAPSVLEPMAENPDNRDSTMAKQALSAVPSDKPSLEDTDSPTHGPQPVRPKTPSKAGAKARPKLTRVK